MESLNDIKKRIKSVTDISQMTHAMQLVSASKMRKSKIQHEKVSPFFTLCAESLMELHRSAKDIDNPFLQMRERKSGTTWKIAYFILTGDQGLAGAYNNNIVKIAEEHIQKKILENAKNSIRTEYKLYVFGHVGTEKLKKDGYSVDPDFSFPITNPTYYEARNVANIIRATHTLTLQQLKLSFLFTENQQFVGNLRVLDIRLSQEGMAKIEAPYTIVEENDVRKLLLPRSAFAHKGQMGNALLIAGSYCMAGAAILAARACLRAGAGKVTINSPKRNIPVLQMSVPEAVIQKGSEETIFAEAVDMEDFSALGIGPGLGQSEQTAIALIAQLRRTQCPIVADADALNILANHRAWLQQLPQGIIMTPHPKEFDRLDGHSADSYERLMKASKLAERLKGYIILKGHYTAICCPGGHILFNSTGNAGMATAGSGDVLTGRLQASGRLYRGSLSAWLGWRHCRSRSWRGKSRSQRHHQLPATRFQESSELNIEN